MRLVWRASGSRNFFALGLLKRPIARIELAEAPRNVAHENRAGQGSIPMSCWAGRD